MRILFIAPFGTCHNQTVSRRMLPLARGLAGRGHTVEVLIPAWDCAAEAGRVQHDGGVTVRWPSLGPTLHPLSDVFLLRRMIQAGRTFRPDLVHAFKSFGYSGALAGWFRRRGRGKVVVDVDDLETVAGWGRQRPLMMRLLGGAQEAQTIRRAHGVTAASLDLRVRAEYLRGFRQKSLYLPNGLDLSSDPAPVAENPPIVLLYTRGNDVDPDRVAALWRRISLDHPPARLRILGDCADAPDLPGGERLGWLEPEALSVALRGGAVALFPVEDSAQNRAKSPARLLDCLAHGLPVVTASVGEYGTLVGGGKWSVEPEDDGALAAATVRLLADPALRVEAGRAAWAQAARHTWALRVDALEAYYRGLGV